MSVRDVESDLTRRKSNMKKLTLLLSLVFAAGVAVAADNAATTSDKSGSSAAPKADAAKSDAAKSDTAKTTASTTDAKGTTHEVTAEVVSANADKKELTIKDD